jgi:hypothetical protein
VIVARQALRFRLRTTLTPSDCTRLKAKLTYRVICQEQERAGNELGETTVQGMFGGGSVESGSAVVARIPYNN